MNDAHAKHSGPVVDDDFDLMILFDIVWARRLHIVIASVILTVAAAVFVYTKSSLYVASSRIFMQKGIARDLEVELNNKHVQDAILGKTGLKKITTLETIWKKAKIAYVGSTKFTDGVVVDIWAASDDRKEVESDVLSIHEYILNYVKNSVPQAVVEAEEAGRQLAALDRMDWKYLDEKGELTEAGLTRYGMWLDQRQRLEMKIAMADYTAEQARKTVVFQVPGDYVEGAGPVMYTFPVSKWKVVLVVGVAAFFLSILGAYFHAMCVFAMKRQAEGK